MKTHRVWWPNVDHAPIFNPFIPETVRRSVSDRVEFPEEEKENEETLNEQNDLPRTDK
jgi:hypothetical protein